MKCIKISVITGVCGSSGSRALDILSKNVDVIKGDRIVVGIDDLSKGDISRIKDHLGKPYFLFIQDTFQNQLCTQISGVWNVYPADMISDDVYMITDIYHEANSFENSKSTGTLALLRWANYYKVRFHANSRNLAICS